MKSLLRDNLIEAVVGLFVVLLAAWFIVFAWGRTGGGMRDSIRVTALFPAANGVSVGTDVRIAGLKVGSGAGQSPATSRLLTDRKLASRSGPLRSESSSPAGGTFSARSMRMPGPSQ